MVEERIEEIEKQLEVISDVLEKLAEHVTLLSKQIFKE
tara:strand:+ start:606 stop:719 length:114 start_codon:yes stop_codon:yes gene_type:complete